ncbi:MAG: hypothetical protein M3N53_05240 [Actinomycetota bacterium]|nr:hypothetical protein [Actinomycetota bacterium]
MSASKIGRLAAVVLSAALFLPHTPALAHTVNHDAFIFVEAISEGFRGGLSSNAESCRFHRRVVLVKVLRTGEHRVVDRTMSNGEGYFRFYAPRARGRFFVRAPWKRWNADGHGHRCWATKSQTITRR